MAALATYSDIIADIKDKYSRKSAAFGSDTDESIRKWITQMEYDIYSERHWPFMKKSANITTVASTEEYTLASDYGFGSLYGVFDATNTKQLFMISDADFDYVYPAGDDTGNPLWYRLSGVDSSNIQNIQFYPIPDGVSTITYRYFKDPTPTDIETDTSNDSEAPILPQRYRRLLVDAVLEELLQKDTNPNADRVNAKYNFLLKKMVRDFAEEPAFRPVMESSDSVRSETPIIRLPDNYPN